MGYVRLRPRPWPRGQDENARAGFREKLDELKENPDVEIWYQDECGVQGDPRPRQVLCRKGSTPRIGFTGKHIRDNVLGAVRPADGKFISLIMPHVDADIFQIFLDHMQEHIGEKRVIMILDNAAWHGCHRLDWGKITPMYLPPYSPDLNPIERIWLNMKQKFFSTFVAGSISELTNHLCSALRFFIFNREVCKSICGS